MKSVHDAVNELKSMSGFEWSDVKGMGYPSNIKTGDFPVWDAIVKVCEYILVH
jgi:hypothetical protein